jgi:hypothetical protein
VGLEQAIDRSFRDEVAFGVGEAHGQFPRRQLRLVQRQIDDPLADIVRDAVPDPIRPGRAIVQGLRPAGLIAIVPAVEGRPGMPSFSSVRFTGRCDCSTSRMISSFSEAGYLMRRPPHPPSCFF